jgi:hypothetical protein
MTYTIIYNGSVHEFFPGKYTITEYADYRTSYFHKFLYTPDTRTFEELQATPEVEGFIMLEGGNHVLTVKGSDINCDQKRVTRVSH